MFDDIGQKTVEEAQAAVAQDLEKIKPLLDRLENIIHGVLDRIQIQILPRK